MSQRSTLLSAVSGLSGCFLREGVQRSYEGLELEPWSLPQQACDHSRCVTAAGVRPQRACAGQSGQRWAAPARLLDRSAVSKPASRPHGPAPSGQGLGDRRPEGPCPVCGDSKCPWRELLVRSRAWGSACTAPGTPGPPDRGRRRGSGQPLGAGCTWVCHSRRTCPEPPAGGRSCSCTATPHSEPRSFRTATSWSGPVSPARGAHVFLGSPTCPAPKKTASFPGPHTSPR